MLADGLTWAEFWSIWWCAAAVGFGWGCGRIVGEGVGDAVRSIMNRRIGR